MVVARGQSMREIREMSVKGYQVSVMQGKFWRSNILPCDYLTRIVNTALYAWNLLRDLVLRILTIKKKENSNYVYATDCDYFTMYTYIKY